MINDTNRFRRKSPGKDAVIFLAASGLMAAINGVSNAILLISSLLLLFCIGGFWFYLFASRKSTDSGQSLMLPLSCTGVGSTILIAVLLWMEAWQELAVALVGSII
ncbi:MAG: hypothetical protein AAF583_11545, partial [Pseudomonadota bacterium]